MHWSNDKQPVVQPTLSSIPEVPVNPRVNPQASLPSTLEYEPLNPVVRSTIQSTPLGSPKTQPLVLPTSLIESLPLSDLILDIVSFWRVTVKELLPLSMLYLD